jgi:hypothetical protein
MLVKNRKHFFGGALLAVTFAIVLVVMFSPVFKGENALQSADRLFNSIAKGSTYYFSELLERSEQYRRAPFEASLMLAAEETATKAKNLLDQAGVSSSTADGKVKVGGALGNLLHSSLRDSEAMFNNKGQIISEKYGFDAKEVLFVWWQVLKELEKDLKKQKRFKEAALVADVMKKGVEVGYNFYGISPQKAASKAGILSFSLIFYVIYTLWWGMAILLLFEGFGLQMKKGVKKEV